MEGEQIGPWAPLKSRLFLMIWLASLVSNTGSWMRDVASGWLMTELAPSPVMVSLVQAATTLPIFLLSLPAGALADILDRRRLLIVFQIALLVVAVLLALAAQTGAMTPMLLLSLVFASGVCAAIAGPAFQAIVPELVARPLLRGGRLLAECRVLFAGGSGFPSLAPDGYAARSSAREFSASNPNRVTLRPTLAGPGARAGARRSFLFVRVGILGAAPADCPPGVGR